MIFLDRDRKGEDPQLDWKIRLFLMGAGLAVVGIGLNSRLIVGVAMAVLLVGFLLRFRRPPT